MGRDVILPTLSVTFPTLSTTFTVLTTFGTAAFTAMHASSASHRVIADAKFALSILAALAISCSSARR